jgi:cytosine/adenosine deaminase-related metal-dependent hydrolase
MENKERISINVKLGLIGRELEIKENFNIEIENGIITHIGNGFSTDSITFSNGILIPAFVNSHVHAADFVCQEMGYNKPIHEVVGDPKSIKYECINNYSKDEIEKSIIKFVYRATKFGSYTILDFREQGLVGSMIGYSAKQELSLNGVKYYLLGRLEENEINETNLHLLYKVSDGYGLSSVSNNLGINKIKNIFYNKIRAVHISETIKQWLRNDFEYIIKEYEPNLIIHGTHLSEEEFRIAKERNISVVLCPRSNMWFSVGLPKVVNAIKNEVNLLIGTDNGGILDPNMWKEMEILLLILRIEDPTSDYSLNILKAATINAYDFLKIKGWIEEGNPIEAGLLVIEGEKSGILNSNNKYLGIIKRGNDIIYSLGAIQNII